MLSLPNAAFSIYQNPASDQLQIVNPSALIFDFTVYDAIGQSIYQSSSQQLQTTIQLTNYYTGLYILQFKTPDTKLVKFFIKK